MDLACHVSFRGQACTGLLAIAASSNAASFVNRGRMLTIEATGHHNISFRGDCAIVAVVNLHQTSYLEETEDVSLKMTTTNMSFPPFLLKMIAYWSGVNHMETLDNN